MLNDHNNSYDKLYSIKIFTAIQSLDSTVAVFKIGPNMPRAHMGLKWRAFHFQ